MELHIKAELVLQLESKRQWIAQVPTRLPKKKYYNEQFLWLDSKGNNMVIGEDFHAAEELGTYPVKIYRLVRAAEALEVQKQSAP